MENRDALSEQQFPADVTLTAEQFATWADHLAAQRYIADDVLRDTILEAITTRSFERAFTGYDDFARWFAGQISVIRKRTEAAPHGILDIAPPGDSSLFLRHEKHLLGDDSVDPFDETLDYADGTVLEDLAPLRRPKGKPWPVRGKGEDRTITSGPATAKVLAMILGEAEPPYIVGLSWAIGWLSRWIIDEERALAGLPAPTVKNGEMAPKGSPERAAILRRRRTARDGVLAYDRTIHAADSQSADVLSRQWALEDFKEMLAEWQAQLRFLRLEHHELMKNLK